MSDFRMWLMATVTHGKVKRDVQPALDALNHIDRMEFALRSIGALAAKSKDPAMVQIAAMAREVLE